MQASLAHQLLPKEQHTKPEEVRIGLNLYDGAMADICIQDYPYLSPIIKEIEAEAKERSDLESLSVKAR